MLQVDTNQSYDTTITAFLIQAFQDDLFIGPQTDVDALEYDGGTDLWKFNNGAGVVMNEAHAAGFDFRVESDVEPYMLFVDGGNNAVGINRAAPSGTKLYIDQDGASSAIPAVIIDQADISEGTINFIASDRGAVTTGTGFPTTSAASFRIEINGTVYVVPCFTDQ